MMTLKTNRLSAAILILVLFILGPLQTRASSFECLRDLMPITDRAAVQSKRDGVEEPFIVNEKYIVFPEVSNGTVTGFFFYGVKSAAYYDAAEIKGRTVSLGDLTFKSADGIYELVAQPAGLETVTVSLLPGFKIAPTSKEGPVVLGASVLPVIGAFVSRPELAKSAYLNPKSMNDIVIQKWMGDRMDRRPASVEDIKINSTILKLKTIQSKDQDDLMQPLRTELKLRKTWIQTHNLDEKAFKQLTLTLEGSCKEHGKTLDLYKGAPQF